MRSPAPHRDARLPAGTRRVLHLDVDAFLASVEQALHPRLRRRPVVVGGPPTSRNLVMSCSYEARAFGVRPGMHLREAARRCPGAIFRDGDSQAAGRLREAVTKELLAFSPRVEVASIDDFFVDLTGTGRLFGCAFDTAQEIRTVIRQTTALPVTIGLASNRLMARLAGKLAKPGGIAEILPGAEEAFLTSLPVAHLPGVGHSIGARLERFAIRTVGELRLVPREVLFASFGRDGLALFDRARGRDEQAVEPTHVEDEHGQLVVRPPRSIQRETTFEPEEGRRPVIEAMLAYLVERAAHRLRSQGLICRSVEVRIRYVDTRARIEPSALPRGGASPSRRQALPQPSDSTDEIWRQARTLLISLPRRRALVKRIGVTLHELGYRSGWQTRLFAEDLTANPEDRGDFREARADRHRRLDTALDQLRARLGFGRVLRGASLPLTATHPLRPDGFRLRTPSLNQ